VCGVRGDQGGIVVGWLTKLVAGMAIVGLFLFDAISLGTGNLGARDDANSAASAASYSYHSNHNATLAYDAAVAAVTNPYERIPAQSFFIEPDGSVKLTLLRQVQTLVLRHLGPLDDYTHLTVTGSAPAPAS
jgi:hypothetical protein